MRYNRIARDTGMTDAELRENLIFTTNEKGELVSCLNRNFLAFSEGLRRDLEALARMAGKASSDEPDLGKYIEAKYTTKGKS